jgi:hypothetical protein
MRLPSDRRQRRPSADLVCGPATPSTAIPARRWKERTAAPVRGPPRPSTAPS